MTARPAATGAVARAVDAVLVLALTAVVLLGLDTAFSDRSYLVVGMIGAAVATAIALACADRGAAPFLLVSVLAFVLLGTMITSGTGVGIEVPSGSRMTTFLRGAITGTTDLLTTIPPIDTSGAAMVVPYAIGFLTAACCAWLGLRTGRPLLPLLPVLLGTAAVSLVATTDPAGATARGAALALLAVSWSAVRASRSTDSGARRRRWTRPVAAVVVVVLAASLGTAVVAAREPGERTATLRGKIGSGAEVDEFDNPLVRFRQFTRQGADEPTVYDTPLMRVHGLRRGTPIRFAVLDVYDGTAWRAGNRTVADANDDVFQRIGSEIAVDRSGRSMEVDVDLARGYASAWLPQSAGLTGVDFRYLDGRAQRGDVRYNPATSAAFVLGGLSVGDDYTYRSVVPTDRLRPGMDPYPVLDSQQDAGAALDPLLRPWLRSQLPPMRRVFSLADYLRKNGRYSDGLGDPTVRPGHDIDRLTDRFFGARRIVGDDEQYAAFMALAANRLGVPARVVVGTVPKHRVVRGRDVEAWVEVRVADGTWRRLPTSRFMSHRPARPGQVPKQAPRGPDESHSGDQGSTGQSGSTGGQHDPAPAQPAPAERGRWLALVSLLALVVPGSKLVRRWWRRAAGDPGRRVVGGWRELADLAADQGRRLPGGLTREAQAVDLGTSSDLAELADRLVFGPDRPTKADAADFWRRLRADRRVVARGVRLHRRVLAWWSPRSLVR